MNQLFYGDNLPRMRKMHEDSVKFDLIYLDPPFNSKRNYNLLYKDMTGRPAPDQDIAFCDTWEMDEDKQELAKKMPSFLKDYKMPDYYVEFWRTWINALQHTNEKLLAYLIYMVQRLIEMKGLLKPTGSIYLHCDPEASHYIKVMMDGIFGHKNYRNELIWHYDGPSRPSRKNFGKKHDVILRYSKTDKFFVNENALFPPKIISKEELEKEYKQHEDGRYYYDLPTGDYTAESIKRLTGEGRIRWTRGGKGKPRVMYFLHQDENGEWVREKQLHDVWNNIPSLGHAGGSEKKGYPTQKPRNLLRRIIDVSTKPGDIVFDPFCGCGTTIYAAQEMEREWVGCDIAILAIQLVANSLYDDYHIIEDKDFEVTGIPVTNEQAKILFDEDPHEFERWIVQHMEGIPTKKSGDRGIDGRIYLVGGGHIILSVKGGNTGPSDVRDLGGVIGREKKNGAVSGCFISLKEPTKEMKREAWEAGKYEYGNREYNRLQLLTIKEILEEHKEIDSDNKYRISKKQMVIPF